MTVRLRRVTVIGMLVVRLRLVVRGVAPLLRGLPSL